MPWTIRVLPLKEESTSSWLARAALMQGCDPLALTGAIWSSWRAWTVDIDRGIPHERLRPLSEASGIATNLIESLALRKDAEKIAGQSLPETKAWPWILALGTRNRARRGGQQYCPACLAQDQKPYYRRHWRFAWHTACPQHEVSLLDRCQACGAPIEPHRLLAEDRHLAQCARCKSDLREARGLPASKLGLAFQSTADEALSDSNGFLGEQPILAADWFATARFLAGLVRQASRRETSKLADAIRLLGIHVDSGIPMASGLPLELMSAQERQALFEATFRLITLGPVMLKEAFLEAGVNATALYDGRCAPPEPVRKIIQGLPDGKRGARKPPTGTCARPRSKRAVMAAWMRLQRKIWA